MAAPKTTDARPRLLLVASQDGLFSRVERLLIEAAWPVDLCPAHSPEQLRSLLASQAWDLLLCADNTPGLSLQTIRRMTEELKLDLPMLLLTDASDQRQLMRAMRQGVVDFIDPEQPARLIPALERELREARQRADHRAALEMLKGSEDRFRALATNLPGMVFQLERDARGAMRFLYVSEGGAPLLGIKTHELLSGNTGFARFTDLIDPADRHDLAWALGDSASKLSLLDWEGRIRTRGAQRLVWVRLRSSPQQVEGAVHWHGIATDISREKEAESALHQSREQLAELSSYLEAAKEEERERIARDIHDELGSMLVALKIESALLAAKLPAADAALRDKAGAIEHLLDQAMGTASRVARELRPGILKEFGLQAAIECQAEDFAQRTGVACQFRCEGEVADLDERSSLALFRIAQEALTNAAKHAHASLVGLRLYRDGQAVVLEVRDNGRGISEQDLNKPKSFGLRGIRERARSLNGDFRVEASEQGGTYLMIRLPLDAGEGGPEDEPQQTLF